ncbi:MAG: peptidoglycan editing factor PgeF [Gammaproteobacteria bacterium]|nr:peptidoglycan editing factor PgeF [Gammaproteobacteria bacterium]
MNERYVLSADWPAPKNIHAFVTTRNGGISEGAYGTFNLANHVGDAPLAVAGNRDLLREALPARIFFQWMDQVHGSDVKTIASAGTVITADGLVTQESAIACCVLTADCLPILLTNQSGTEIAAVHGGWRGLRAGILHSVIDSMRSKPDEIMAWLGPAIGPCHYQVGLEIREAFLKESAEDEAESVSRCFSQSDDPEKLQFDLYALARFRLGRLGVSSLYGGSFCTHCDEKKFYSFRRDGVTGRMASIIFMAEAE